MALSKAHFSWEKADFLEGLMRTMKQRSQDSRERREYEPSHRYRSLLGGRDP
jgi:hypothetical protein